jgi:hypothetical protein
MKTDKEFKCVDFKHHAQMGIYKAIKNLTPEGEIKYFRRKVETSVFSKMWERLHETPVIAGRHGKR